MTTATSHPLFPSTQSLLERLLRTNKDGQRGYLAASQDTEDETLGTLFARRSQQRGQSARDLEDAMRLLGERVNVGGTILGALHRSWIGARGLITEESDEALLRAILYGEANAIRSYEQVLQDARWDRMPETRIILDDQLVVLQRVSAQLQDELGRRTGERAESWLRAHAVAFAGAHRVINLATIGPEGPWASTQNYSAEDLSFYLFAEARGRLARNVAADARFAGTIFNEVEAEWGHIKGIEVEGRAVLVDDPAGRARIYARLFAELAPEETQLGDPGERSLAARPLLYRLRPDHIFFFDPDHLPADGAELSLRHEGGS